MRVILVGWAVLFLGAVAHADTLLLQDGRALVGPRVEKTPNGVTVHLEPGAIHVPASQVLARYDEDDPGAALQLRAHRKHRHWRDRYTETVGPFRFETTMPLNVFRLYRDHVVAFHHGLCKELGVEPPADVEVEVCLFANGDEFRQIAGAGRGVMAFHYRTANEICGFDDPARRSTCLRAVQWATTSWLVPTVLPHLPHDEPLSSALIDYFAAARSRPDAKGAFTFGLVEGGLYETLRPLLDEEPRTPDARRPRDAWAWAALHRWMADAGRKDALLRRLRELPQDDPAEGDVLVPLADGWKNEAVRAHARTLRPSTAADLVGAGRVAEHAGDRARARRYYTDAVAREPTCLEAHVALARLEEAARDGKAEAAAWRAVLELDPLNTGARDSLAYLLGRLGRHEEADAQEALVNALRAVLTER